EEAAGAPPLPFERWLASADRARGDAFARVTRLPPGRRRGTPRRSFRACERPIPGASRPRSSARYGGGAGADLRSIPRSAPPTPVLLPTVPGYPRLFPEVVPGPRNGHGAAGGGIPALTCNRASWGRVRVRNTWDGS